MLIAPRLSSTAAGSKIDASQAQLAEPLREIGEAVRDPQFLEQSTWNRNITALERTVEHVRQALAEADESRKGNPRALLHRRDVGQDQARLEVLEAVAFHVRDLSAVLADTVWEQPGSLGFDEVLTAPLSRACVAVADAIEHHEHGPDQSASTHRARGEAARSIRELVQTVDATTALDGSAMGPGVYTAMHLRRILMHLRDTSENPSSE